MHFNSFHITWRKNIITLHNLNITHTSFRSEPVAWLPASAFGLSRFEMAMACMAKSELWNTPLTPQLSYWCNILRMLLHHTMNVATLSVCCLESACWSSMIRWYQGRPRWGCWPALLATFHPLGCASALQPFHSAPGGNNPWLQLLQLNHDTYAAYLQVESVRGEHTRCFRVGLFTCTMNNGLSVQLHIIFGKSKSIVTWSWYIMILKNSVTDWFPVWKYHDQNDPSLSSNPPMASMAQSSLMGWAIHGLSPKVWTQLWSQALLSSERRGAAISKGRFALRDGRITILQWFNPLMKEIWYDTNYATWISIYIYMNLEILE